MTSSTNTPELEILISTMNRISLDFLLPVFPEHFSNYNLLIINQTSEDRILQSNLPNIRVINQFDKGLSKSRNCAITHSIGSILLIADDDVKYHPKFDYNIINAFAESDSDVITFNHQRDGLPQNLGLKKYIHNKNTIRKVCSVEIAFRSEIIKNKKILFDVDFGLGSHFESSEELLFLRDVLQKNLTAGFDPTVIVDHALNSTGKDQGGDKQISAWSALSYKIRGPLTYLLLPKFLIYLMKSKFIRREEYFYKFKVGYSAIKRFKELQNKTDQNDDK